tara:strand:+ start:14110 stop:14301 length:192 start_codon:yes stop_codon:yes gene_type:complete
MEDKSIVGILGWVVGVIVSLAVGSGMINGTLTVPGIPDIITVVAGWVVVVGAVVGVVLAIFNK